MLWSKKWRKALCLLLCTVFFVSLSVALQMPLQEAFQGKIRITQGYSARQGKDGVYYVLDNGHERLICFDRTGRVRFVIENPTDAEGDTLYIDDFFISGDGIYLSVTKWDKMRIMQEKILFYDANGRYAGSFLERDYSEYRTNKHRFYGINEKNGMAAVLVLMGLGASFGKTVQRNYYLCLKEVNQYGVDKAMGVYNFSENIGESLGPVVFGRLMAAARFSMALGAFCGVVAGLGVTHFLVCGKELGNGQSEGI